MELLPAINKKTPFGLSDAYYQTEILNIPFFIARLGDEEDEIPLYMDSSKTLHYFYIFPYIPTQIVCFNVLKK